jgi:hypothetical protein
LFFSKKKISSRLFEHFFLWSNKIFSSEAYVKLSTYSIHSRRSTKEKVWQFYGWITSMNSHLRKISYSCWKSICLFIVKNGIFTTDPLFRRTSHISPDR